MATSGNGRKSTKGKSAGKSSSSRKSTSAKKNTKKQNDTVEFAYKNELIMLGVFAVLIFIFLCVIKVISSSVDGKNNLGDYIRMFFTGLFGISAYYLPIAAIALTVLFRVIERDRSFYIRFGAIILLMFTFGIFSHVFTYGDLESYVGSKDWASVFYSEGTGGGLLFGAVSLLMFSAIGRVGTVFVTVLLTIVGLGVFALPYIPALIEFAHREREYDDEYEEDEEEEEEEELPPVKTRRRNPAPSTASQRPVRKTETVVDHDLSKLQKKEIARREARDVSVKAEYQEPEKQEGLQLMNSSVPVFKRKPKENPANSEAGKGIVLQEKPETNNIHPVTVPVTEEETDTEDWIRPVQRNTRVPGADAGITLSAKPSVASGSEGVSGSTYGSGFGNETGNGSGKDFGGESRNITEIKPEGPTLTPAGEALARSVTKNASDDYEGCLDHNTDTNSNTNAQGDGMVHLRSRDKAGLSKSLEDFKEPAKPAKQYRLPSTNLLKPVDKKGKVDDQAELEETARRLKETLDTFGVRVNVTDYSKGPAVTRYELQPELGVKVSKIVSLADDIKLNLAAADIRIEAPIPGKQAVGIEVPNRVASSVGLRELLESKEYKEFKSNIAFAVGKDIAGDVVVSDLAKMPHMLIAGATGSGKSVCINTLIMSILFKAHPDDVKMILVDPKVVELSVYNGIPHLLLPVVTDPKQASAALQWGVNEMNERYRKFADFGVRDLKGFNEKAANQAPDVPEEERIKKMPQIVIVVDELADLMMVASKEVEESICRLAQLARAAGIHLIIATQRPSVDVITGLIKANMPSRIAFSVSSGIDSRTILDANGAEKLLGKGDMLFFPQWLNKPSRVQGAFVSDDEVASVVDFIKNQNICSNYQTDIPTVISSNISGGTGLNAAGGAGDGRDEYFAEAGRFVIDKEKGSIGMLQRIFKIGFNRAARIMDQLEEAGVVGPEEGTKPRRILMTMDEFEEFLQNQ